MNGSADPPLESVSSPAADPEADCRSHLDNLDHRTLDTEAGSDQRAAVPGAPIKGHGKPALDDAAPVVVNSPDDAPKSFDRGSKIEDVLTAPPEGVSLRRERARGVNRSMDKEQISLLGEGGMTKS